MSTILLDLKRFMVPREQPTSKMPKWASMSLWALVAVLAVSISSWSTNESALDSSSTVQIAVLRTLPILLAGLGGLWAERAGVTNIGLEGMMILGTWGSAWGSHYWGVWAGVLFGAVLGALGGLVHAIATVTFGVNQIISGVAMNLLGAGIAKYLSTLVFFPFSQNPRESGPVPVFDKYSVAGLSQWLGDLEGQQRFFLSDVAGIVRGLVTGLTPLTILAVLLIPASYWILWHTQFGLRTRSAGESPVAAESLGVNVYRYKYIAVVMSGAFAGLGGATLVLNPGGSGYLENQTDGRGYIGLAAMIFGNWRPGGLLAGASLFGYTDGLRLGPGIDAVMALVYAAVLLLVAVVAVRLVQRKWKPAVYVAVGAVALYIFYLQFTIPEQLAAYTPHIVTLIVLGVSSQRLRPPRTVGMSYRRGEGD